MSAVSPPMSRPPLVGFRSDAFDFGKIGRVSRKEGGSVLDAMPTKVLSTAPCKTTRFNWNIRYLQSKIEIIFEIREWLDLEMHVIQPNGETPRHGTNRLSPLAPSRLGSQSCPPPADWLTCAANQPHSGLYECYVQVLIAPSPHMSSDLARRDF